MFSFIIKYWVQILFSLLVTLITHINNNIYKYIKKIKEIEKQFCLNIKLHIMEEKEEILDLYNIYKKLDCESVVDVLVQNLEKVPIKKVP